MKRLIPTLLALVLLAGSARANNLSKAYINEVLYNPAGPDSANQRLEIVNGGTSPVVLTNWSICVQFNYKRFPSGATIPPGGVYVVYMNRVGVNTAREFYTGPYVNWNPTGDSVGLFHTFSGFGTPANMEDFVEWGATGQPRENVAISAGIWTTGNFIPLGPEGQSIAYNNRTATPPNVLPHQLADYCYEAPTFGMTNSCSITGPVVLNEILADPAGPNAGATVVEVVNAGTAAVNLTGWQWTTQLANGSFGVNQTLGAGKYLLIQMNAAGATNDTTLFTGPAVDLNPAAGSFALYKNSADFTNPANLVDFVEWGASGQAREAEAAAAGQWPAGTFVPVVAEGHSIGYTSAGNDAASWCDQNPPTLRAPTGCLPVGCVCTALRINEILADPPGAQTGATRVELVNTGASALDIRNLNVVAGPSHYRIPSSLTVPAGGLVVVHVNESGADTPSDVYTGPALPDLNPAAGTFGLFIDDQDFTDPARIIDFLEWGSGAQPGEGVAVAAGIWTAGAFFPGTLEGTSVQWRGTGSGDQVSDFCADQPTLGSTNVCTTSGVGDPGSGSGIRPLLLQNYPNPVSRGTSIVFELARPETFVSVTLFTIAGSPVRRLMRGPAPAGATALSWDGRDDSGRVLPGGIYVYALTTGDGTITRKLSLFR